MHSGFPSSELVALTRIAYPAGRRVELVRMSDPYTDLRLGAQGTIQFVDDIGTIFVAWDNGSHLGCCLGVDEIRLLLE